MRDTRPTRCYGVGQMTEFVTILPFAVLGLLVGVFIGCVGIGGVLLVPGLPEFSGSASVLSSFVGVKSPVAVGWIA